MKRAPKRLIVPVFLPQAGCSHRCVFCSQESLTGRMDVPTPEEATAMLSDHLGAGTADATIAFYGGSFTGLAEKERDEYLKVASSFVLKGLARGIRLSTRPDMVDKKVAGELSAAGVTEVELGVQSMDDRVLKACARGHTVSDTAEAVGALKSAGIGVGLQLMSGLPADTREGFLKSCRDAISLGPDFVRVFPTIVVSGAPLERLWERGGYIPDTLESAVSVCADAAELFDEAGIPVVRFGLQATESLDKAYLAGPYHPAFGHMVESERAFRRMSSALGPGGVTSGTEFRVNPRELSVYKGISGTNLTRLMEFCGGTGVAIRQDPQVEPGGLVLVKP